MATMIVDINGKRPCFRSKRLKGPVIDERIVAGGKDPPRDPDIGQKLYAGPPLIIGIGVGKTPTGSRNHVVELA